MKSIIKQRVFNKNYYLGRRVSYSYHCFRQLELYDTSDELGEVTSDNAFVEIKIISETENLHRELKQHEMININDNRYTIAHVIHDVNGDFIYTVQEELHIENEESKLKAIKELELRKVYLQGKKDGIAEGYFLASKEMTTTAVVNEEPKLDVRVEPKKKKWFL
jgi:hypothetical protein